jgi:orotate phosphoribosyltransferase
MGATNPEYRARLKALLCRESVQAGKTVRLKSGRESHFYVDCRTASTHPEGAFLIAELILELIEGQDVAAIGGPTLGADPIVGAICYASYCHNRPLDGFIVRKAAKEHGKGKAIEGRLPEGGKVVVVEDVITTGGSVLAAVRQVEDAGAEVTRIIALVDRQEGGREAIEEAGYPFTAIYTREELTEGCGEA